MPTGYRPPQVSGVSSGTNATDYVRNALYPESLVKAWTYITVTGGVPAITEDHNIASLTDNGVGDVTLTFARAMATASYSLAGGGFNLGGSISVMPTSMATTTIRYDVRNSADGASDVDHQVIVCGRQ